MPLDDIDICVRTVIGYESQSGSVKVAIAHSAVLYDQGGEVVKAADGVQAQTMFDHKHSYNSHT